MSNEHLRAFVERIERLEEEVRVTNADKSEVYKEAKGYGLNVTALKDVIRTRRKMEGAQYQTNEADFDLYMQALRGTGTVGAARAHTSQDSNLRGEGIPAGDDGSPSTPSEPEPAPSTSTAVAAADVNFAEGSQAAPGDGKMPLVPAFLRRTAGEVVIET